MREGQRTNRTMIGLPAIMSILVLGVGLILTACQSEGEPAPVQDLTLQAATTPGTTPAGTPSPAAGRAIKPGGTTTPDSRNINISPQEVTMGNIVLTLSVQPAQAVFEPGRAPSSGNEGDGQKTPIPQRGFVVLGGSTLRITNNFDAAQNPPADSPKELLRHVGVQIRDQASGQLIPYAVVSMDLLREGRATLQDQALVPMLQNGMDVSQMHYGNNVKFPGNGEYQVFVRMEPSPLLGPGSMGVAQFNVSIK